MSDHSAVRSNGEASGGKYGIATDDYRSSVGTAGVERIVIAILLPLRGAGHERRGGDAAAGDIVGSVKSRELPEISVSAGVHFLRKITVCRLN